MRAGQSATVRFARIALVIPVAVALVVAGCGGDGEDEPGATSEQPTVTGGADGDGGAAGSAVTIQAFVFEPSRLEVATGTEVTWTNEDETEHTVTAGTPEKVEATFDQALAAAGDTFAFTFAAPGTYPYFCRRHSSITGEIVVR